MTWNKQAIKSFFAMPWPVWLVAFAITGEIYLFVIDRGGLGLFASPVVFTILGLVIGLVPLLGLGKKAMDNYQVSFSISLRVQRLIVWVIGLLGTIISTIFLIQLWAEIPVGLQYTGDVIPSVELFAQRLLGEADGKPVYAPYDGFGYRLDPTYMPFQWLPFVISELGDFDSRWMPWIIFLGGIVLYYLLLNKAEMAPFWRFLLAAAPFLVILESLREHDNFISWSMLANTIELMDVGYYFLLAYSLLVGGLWLRSAGILLPLMSRFSFAFWMPFYLLASFIKESQRKAFLIGVNVVMGIVLIYILPFLSQDWTSFSKGQAHYDRAAVGAWTMDNAGNVYPNSMQYGLGLAIFFYDKDQPLEPQVKKIQRVHLIASIFAAFAVGLLYLVRHKSVSVGLYFLWGLKAYFAIFYAFIQVPYAYLYLLPCMLSFWVMMSMFKQLNPT